ncbi:class I SAM-dependent methyltransferase [Xanthomonas indica]|uniref:class I SAM-dependent methyltransferase n=1 Tax=Xanthomonas indica TaxID=2912242 RepID=UPI0028834EEA|nr:class I SAM-dependent methyltransferase [Xanthomonas indica]
MPSLWEGLQSRRAVRRCQRKHPPQDAKARMEEAAGFARSHYKNLAGGIVAIDSATRSEWRRDWGLKIRDW